MFFPRRDFLDRDAVGGQQEGGGEVVPEGISDEIEKL
jgi:hypothetical protein